MKRKIELLTEAGKANLPAKIKKIRRKILHGPVFYVQISTLDTGILNESNETREGDQNSLIIP